MTKKKNTPDVEDVQEDLQQPTAEEVLEAELADEELLADLPELRPAHRLRLRHKNRIMEIFVGYQGKAATLKVKSDGDAVSNEQALLMLDIAAEIDQFAESIAVDADAYIEWAEANSDSPEKFFAILHRYMGAVGESKSSAN